MAHTARQERVLHRGMYDSAEVIMTWHTDTYEKLKPHGFIVHGCVDGGYTTELRLSYILASITVNWLLLLDAP